MIEKNQALRILMALTVTIFFVESMVMFFMQLVALPHLVEMFLDGLLLVGILLPVLYLSVSRPLLLQIVQRRQAEEELKRQKEFSENILKTMTDGVDIVDQNCNIQFMNKSFMDIFGKDAIGKKCYEVYKTDKKQCEFCPLHGEIKLEETKALEVPGMAGGKTFLVSHTGMRNPDGSFSILEVFRDITELKRAEADRLKLAELRESDRLKTEFMSIVSHELKTPLTPIISYIYMFLDEQFGKLAPEYIKAAEVMQKQSSHLLSLIDSVLDMARITTGKALELNKEPLSMQVLLNDISFVMQPQFEKRKMKVEIELPADFPTLMADPIKIRRLFVNLFGNALKFTPEGGWVKIVGLKEDDTVQLQVIDNGIGIAKENLEKVFEKFYQVDSSFTRAAGGIGMGLTIAREIVEAHGGKIWAESEGLGRGTRIIFILPIT